ncbi:MAG: hypothetical protein ACJA0P_002022 [Planctomycetota bacterium]|jgi:hypothetical protein
MLGITRPEGSPSPPTETVTHHVLSPRCIQYPGSMHRGQRMALACVAIACAGAFSMLVRNADAPGDDAIDRALPKAVEAPPGAETPALRLTGSPGAAIARGQRAAVMMEDAPPRDLDDEAQVERRWLLSFPIQAEISSEISSGVSSGVSNLLVEMPDRARHTARLHPESGLFRVELVGTRAELQEMELTVASGRAMTEAIERPAPAFHAVRRRHCPLTLVSESSIPRGRASPSTGPIHGRGVE